ncbi:MAG: hypothetical protein ACR2RF_33365, partial [Geminicoccaceae bacterium]
MTQDTPEDKAVDLIPMDQQALEKLAQDQGYDLIPSGQAPPSQSLPSRSGNAWSLMGEIASPDQAMRKEQRHFRYALIGAGVLTALGLGCTMIIAGTVQDMFTASLEVTNRAMGVIEHQATVAGEVTKHREEIDASKSTG